MIMQVEYTGKMIVRLSSACDWCWYVLVFALGQLASIHGRPTNYYPELFVETNAADTETTLQQLHWYLTDLFHGKFMFQFVSHGCLGPQGADTEAFSGAAGKSSALERVDEVARLSAGPLQHGSNSNGITARNQYRIGNLNENTGVRLESQRLHLLKHRKSTVISIGSFREPVFNLVQVCVACQHFDRIYFE